MCRVVISSCGPSFDPDLLGQEGTVLDTSIAGKPGAAWVELAMSKQGAGWRCLGVVRRWKVNTHRSIVQKIVIHDHIIK